jgi:hypothetical protein
VLKDQVRLKSLVYKLSRKDGGARGAVIIHGLPPEADDIRAWQVQLNLGVEYKGEGLPAISAVVHQQLLRRRERVYFTGEQKGELLEQYEHRCALCDRQSSAFEWDHIERFSESLGEQRFQPLCPECHRATTATDAQL